MMTEIPRASPVHWLARSNQHNRAGLELTLVEDALLAIEPRPRNKKDLRRSAMAPNSQKEENPAKGGSLRRSELPSSSVLGLSITTMENADVDAIILAIGAVVQAYAKDAVSKSGWRLARNAEVFDEDVNPLDASGQWRYVPKAQTIEVFVRTVQVALELDESSLVIALILLERAMGPNSSGLVLCARTWRPATLIAIVIASKVVYDEKVFLSDYREMLPELCLDAAAVQELELLKLISYNTTVRRGQYAKYYYALEDVARSQLATLLARPSSEVP